MRQFAPSEDGRRRGLVESSAYCYRPAGVRFNLTSKSGPYSAHGQSVPLQARRFFALHLILRHLFESHPPPQRNATEISGPVSLFDGAAQGMGDCPRAFTGCQRHQRYTSIADGTHVGCGHAGVTRQRSAMAQLAVCMHVAQC